jgi:hypothetical protein
MFDLDGAIKSALKSKDQAALVGYRSLKAKVLNKLTEPGRGQGKPLSDEELLALVRREIKERNESNEFLDAARPEYQENARIVAVLERLLPRGLSDEELDTAIRRVLEEVKPSGPREIGKVMAALRQIPGVDMAAASARVKALLAGPPG